MKKGKNYKNNPFLAVFLGFSLISCLILCLAFLSILHERKQEANKQYDQEKANTLLNDFCIQVESLEDFAGKLVINDTYMYSTVFREKYNEYALLEDFKQYQNFSFLTEHMFLYYKGSDMIFCAEGNTVFQETFFQNLSLEEKSVMEDTLYHLENETEALLLSDSLYLLIPFKADYGLNAPRAVLGTVLSQDVLEKRLALVGGVMEGAVALYKNDRLLYCSAPAACDDDAKNAVLAVSPEDGFTLRYIPQRSMAYSLTDFLQTALILLIILTILGLAILAASRMYRPLHNIFEKYSPKIPLSDPSKFSNVYEEIEGLIDTAMQDKLAAAVEAEQKQELLKKHILMSILNGVYIPDAETYLEKLNISLPGPFYYVISIVFQQEIDETFWDFLQRDLKKNTSNKKREYLYAIGDCAAGKMWLICSIWKREYEEDLTGKIQKTIDSYAYPAVVGVGKVYRGLQKLQASWLESMDHLSRHAQAADLKYSGHSIRDLQWLSDALSTGNEELVLQELKNYVQWIGENQQSMLAQLYIFSEFVGELARLSRANSIELSSQTISLVLSAKTLDSFFDAAREAILEYCGKLKNLAREKAQNKEYQICAYIQAHFTEYDLSIDAVADSMHVPSTDVRSAVYNVTGKKYTDYITSLRMEYAKELISQEKLSVAEICEAVGYSSVSYFIKQFKETTGTTPAKYRKEKGTFHIKKDVV